MSKPRRVVPAAFYLVLSTWIVLSGWSVFSRNGVATGADATPPAEHAYELFMLPCAEGYEAIRWNTQTGASWWTDSTSTEWRKCGEQGAVPSGSYVVQGTQCMQNGKNIFTLLRFEQHTGKTWFLNNRSWQPMVDADPPGKK